MKLGLGIWYWSVAILLLIIGVSQGGIVVGNHVESQQTELGLDPLSRFVSVLADANIITREDIQVYGRQARENPLSELVFDVFKELVGDVLSMTVGSYLGLDNRRNSEEFSLFNMVMSAVRKNTLQKRMGCPT
ncbi:uncharacterized protein LOC131879253 [Tigriopus californicus]|uniref:uncharacterized protein LOC131879253 n=1 Tax=Tigriopus californicus TaxID=6832 RepID=UPI0027DA1273|nr:uncharacterized protein LOC131879253 [Tigriopus californicus]